MKVSAPRPRWNPGFALMALVIALLPLTGFFAPASAQYDNPYPWSGEILDLLPDINGDPFLMSADGQYIAGTNHTDALCVWAMEDGSETCDTSGTPVDRFDRMIDWSPDGTALAFANAAAEGEDRDIHIFDIATGSSVNVTDDGLTDLTVTGQELTYETYPAWSIDSQSLAFVRTVLPAVSSDSPPDGATEVPIPPPTVLIMTINRDGSSPTLRAEAGNPFRPGLIGSPMIRLADDSLVFAFNTVSPLQTSRPLESRNVVRLLPDGTTAILMPDDDKMADPYLMDATSDDTHDGTYARALTVDLSAVGDDPYA